MALALTLSQKLEEILNANIIFQLRMNQLETQLNSVTNFLKKQFGDEFVSSAGDDFIANLPSRASADTDDGPESDAVKALSLSKKCEPNSNTTMEQNLIRITRDHIIKVEVNDDDVERVETKSSYLEGDEDPLRASFGEMASILSTDQEEDPLADDLSSASNGIEGVVVVSDGEDITEVGPNWNPAIKPVTRVVKIKRTKTAQNSYQCDWPGCNRSFKEKRMFRRHKINHAREKPFLCDWQECKQKFARHHDFIVHKRIHTGEKPYMCDWPNCKQEFRYLARLVSHKRTHTGEEKPYICDWEGCGRQFSHSNTLINHKRSHTGEKPYICNFPGCGKGFATRSSLNSHQITHTGEKH